jgi:hypothetical protein
MCDERERLIDYIYDESGPEERRRVDQHLDTCEDCRREIEGLRQARRDLLAWGVPSQESVWRPFAPAQPIQWWRQVPAWSLAAAAGVVFMLGAAGGASVQVLRPETTVVSAPAVQPAGPVVVPAAVTPAALVPQGVTEQQLTAAEQRILQMMREEMDERFQQASSNQRLLVRAASTGSPAGDEPFGPRGTPATREEMMRLLTAFNNDMARLSSDVSEVRTLNDEYRRRGFIQVSAPGR